MGPGSARPRITHRERGRIRGQVPPPLPLARARTRHLVWAALRFDVPIVFRVDAATFIWAPPRLMIKESINARPGDDASCRSSPGRTRRRPAAQIRALHRPASSRSAFAPVRFGNVRKLGLPAVAAPACWPGQSAPGYALDCGANCPPSRHGGRAPVPLLRSLASRCSSWRWRFDAESL